MLKVSAPEMVSGVSGESEQKLRELFDLAVVRTCHVSLLTLSLMYTVDSEWLRYLPAELRPLHPVHR